MSAFTKSEAQPSSPTVPGSAHAVCFFVLCKRFPTFTLHLNSDAGYAVLLPTLLVAPVSIGRALGGLMA